MAFTGALVIWCLVLGSAFLFTEKGARASTSPTEEIYYYHTDQLGTPLKMSDKDGNIVWSMECTPFQESCNISGTITNNLRFPGQYYDAETGLHYNWHRYYNPKLGRYMSPDSMGGSSDNPQSYNPYPYGANNPINRIDPSGLWPTETHNRIIYDFFWSILSADGRSRIEQGSADVDKWANQLPGMAYKHAMREMWQTVAQAEQLMMNFIDIHIYNFKKEICKDKFEAYYELGEALHPVMDSTAPSHRGFQVWNPADFGEHKKLEAIMTQAEHDETIIQLKQVIQQYNIEFD